jgi:hypothetical protein
MRQTGAWIQKADIPDEEKLELARRVRDAVWLNARSLQRHLWQAAEDEEGYVRDVAMRMPPGLATEMIQARHRPTRAVYEISDAINRIPLNSVQRSSIDKAVSGLCDAVGGCDRIFGSPVPTFYTRFAFQFLEIWILTLPLALYKLFDGMWNHWGVIPISVLLAFFFLGLGELALQLEEPFSVLPLDKIANGIDLSADEHYLWLENSLNGKYGQHQSVPPRRPDEYPPDHPSIAAIPRTSRSTMAAASLASIQGNRVVLNDDIVPGVQPVSYLSQLEQSLNPSLRPVTEEEENYDDSLDNHNFYI